jgi:hypothetical protein
MASKIIKHHGINSTKETKDIFNENYKPLKREIEEDIRRWKDLPCSWARRINIGKWQWNQKQSTCPTQSISKFQ